MASVAKKREAAKAELLVRYDAIRAEPQTEKQAAHSAVVEAMGAHKLNDWRSYHYLAGMCTSLRAERARASLIQVKE